MLRTAKAVSIGRTPDGPGRWTCALPFETLFRICNNSRRTKMKLRSGKILSFAAILSRGVAAGVRRDRIRRWLCRARIRMNPDLGFGESPSAHGVHLWDPTVRKAAEVEQPWTVADRLKLSDDQRKNDGPDFCSNIARSSSIKEPRSKRRNSTSIPSSRRISRTSRRSFPKSMKWRRRGPISKRPTRAFCWPYEASFRPTSGRR